VCDLESRDAVQLLYDLKGAAPSKQLSILCRSFSDVSTHTLGFPVSTAPGQPDFFRIARHILPGPYTIILQASKALPKQITNYQSGRKKTRSTVGIRLTADPVCQALLERLDRPLLCSTVKLGADDGDDGVFSPDAAVIADAYGPRGLSFVVDAGRRVAEASTVIDLSGGIPVLVRQGKGDASWLEEFGGMEA
jgi:tRNA threonylcarbamoyl adenosine modification protein (Sua5/YciO/YrdC/YwlC family)